MTDSKGVAATDSEAFAFYSGISRVAIPNRFSGDESAFIFKGEQQIPREKIALGMTRI